MYLGCGFIYLEYESGVGLDWFGLDRHTRADGRYSPITNLGAGIQLLSGMNQYFAWSELGWIGSRGGR